MLLPAAHNGLSQRGCGFVEVGERNRDGKFIAPNARPRVFESGGIEKKGIRATAGKTTRTAAEKTKIAR